jgi:hypothetical protein
MGVGANIGVDTGVDPSAALGIDASTLMGVDAALFVPQAQVQQQPAFNFTVPLYPQALDLRAGDSVSRFLRFFLLRFPLFAFHFITLHV